MKVWQGDYTVNGMEISDSETNLKINEDGLNNYIIVRKQLGAQAGEGPLFALSNVSIHNATVHYLDLRVLHDFTFKSTER